MGLCVIDGYTYPSNPRKNKNLPLESTSEVVTLGGGYVTDFGEFDFDRIIEHSWTDMDTTFWSSLLTKRRKKVSMTLVDEQGTSYTVVITSLTHEGYIEGTESFYENVKITYRVVS